MKAVKEWRGRRPPVDMPHLSAMPAGGRRGTQSEQEVGVSMEFWIHLEASEPEDGVQDVEDTNFLFPVMLHPPSCSLVRNPSLPSISSSAPPDCPDVTTFERSLKEPVRRSTEHSYRGWLVEVHGCFLSPLCKRDARCHCLDLFPIRRDIYHTSNLRRLPAERRKEHTGKYMEVQRGSETDRNREGRRGGAVVVVVVKRHCKKAGYFSPGSVVKLSGGSVCEPAG
ncbi:hypothetical protein INR49_016227 [Caranx melampygus]|nr:hypothetical protein INR49_016227 [Caranx melampygus]